LDQSRDGWWECGWERWVGGGVVEDQDGGQVIATARSLVGGVENVMFSIESVQRVWWEDGDG
jgi:hypothetical protein